MWDVPVYLASPSGSGSCWPASSAREALPTYRAARATSWSRTFRSRVLRAAFRASLANPRHGSECQFVAIRQNATSCRAHDITWLTSLAKLRRARSFAHLGLKQAEAQITAYQTKAADLESQIQAIAPELRLPARHREPNPRRALRIMREEGRPLIHSPMEGRAICSGRAETC